MTRYEPTNRTFEDRLMEEVYQTTDALFVLLADMPAGARLSVYAAYSHLRVPPSVFGSVIKLATRLNLIRIDYTGSSTMEYLFLDELGRRMTCLIEDEPDPWGDLDPVP